MDRRSSLLNIDDWLDECSNEEPDSMIYDAQFPTDIAKMRATRKFDELVKVYSNALERSAQIGLTSDKIEQRLDDLDEWFSRCCKTIDQEMEADFEKLCHYKQTMLDQVQKMLSDLYLPPYVPDDSITLLQHCKRLKVRYTELDKVKQQRMVRLKELRSKQTGHCLILGIEVPQIKMRTDIPTDEELTQLAKAVTDLESEERKRRLKSEQLRESIAKCLIELESEPQTDLPAGLTEANLLELSNLHEKLEKQRLKNEEKFKQLRSRLESLYNRLDVPEEEREEFLGSHNVCKPSLMVEIEEEIKKYEELKRKNIGKFIDKIKADLEVEYNRCFVSQKEQDAFFALSEEPSRCNEDLLDLHEREFERINRYYEDNKEILEKIHKWRLMWAKLISLEVKANDPNRFNNRGGQLLQEERERKSLQKGLPKVETELIALNDQYAANNGGHKFKVLGTDLDEFIAGCWDELNTAKEEQKRQRQLAKKTVTPASVNQSSRAPQANLAARRTPLKRPACGMATPTPTPSKLKCQTNIPRIGAGSRTKLASTPSELSINEQEFEKMIIRCPTSAKRNR